MDIKASEFFSLSGKNTSGYKQFVRDQVTPMKVDELKVVELGIKDVQSFRMNLNQVANELGYKFKTKVVEGELYVGRIS